MTDALVLGVDSSTSGCKAIAWSPDGQVVAEGREAVSLDNPQPDAWQQDAESWWHALGKATRQLPADVRSRLVAMSVTHQRETIVVTDALGKPRAPALVWMDGRSGAQVKRAEAALGSERLHELSGKPPCTTPSLYKLMHLFEERPELARAPLRVLDVHAFLSWRLTGHCATSLASADPTGLLDMAGRRWAPELLALLGLDEDAMPALLSPGETLGEVTDEAAQHTGLPAGLRVVAGAGDGQAAGLGAGIIAPGRAYLNLGTAIVSGVLSERYRCDRAFRTLYGASEGSFFCETDLKGGTFTINWLVERFLGGRLEERLPELEREALTLPPGSDGLVVVPYWNGVMNPLWDDEASGVVLGWRGSHRPGHLYRAILEGIAFEQKYHFQAVEAVLGPISEFVVMGGGSESDLWCQILADTLQRPLVRSQSREATSLGAGVLAAVSAGLHTDIEAACGAMVRLGKRFEPGAAQAFYQKLYEEVYQGLYLDIQERMQRLWRLRKPAG